MSDWLQGNIARSQNTLQAIDAKGKIRQRADDRMSKLGDTISKYTLPKMQQKLDIEKEEKLWGEGGVRNQLQKDILDIQHKNTLTEQSTLNSLQADREKEFATHKSEITDKLWNERTKNAPKRHGDGSFTNEYLIHAYGIDRWWQEQQISMRNRDANKDLYRSVHEWFSQNSKDWVANWGDAFEIDPATGEVTRLKAEREEELINYLVTAYDNDRLQKKSVPNGTDGDGKTIWRQLTGEEMRPIFQQYSETFPWEEMGAGTETGDSRLTTPTQNKLKAMKFSVGNKASDRVKTMARALELITSASRNALNSEEAGQELLNRAAIYKQNLVQNAASDVAMERILSDAIKETHEYANANLNPRVEQMIAEGQNPFAEFEAIKADKAIPDPQYKQSLLDGTLLGAFKFAGYFGHAGAQRDQRQFGAAQDVLDQIIQGGIIPEGGIYGGTTSENVLTRNQREAEAQREETNRIKTQQEQIDELQSYIDALKSKKKSGGLTTTEEEALQYAINQKNDLLNLMDEEF